MKLRHLSLILVLSIACGVAGPVRSDTSSQYLVTDVPDGDTIFVEPRIDEARVVRLVGIEAPQLGGDRPGLPTWPLAHAARDVLAALALGRDVRLTWSDHDRDRHGRLLAQVHRADGVWLQGELLRRGFARVHSYADNRDRVDEMLAIEAAAREAERGIWSHPFYAVRTPETVQRDIDSFQIVEGRVVEAKKVKGTLYLNFGADWRTDFTVAIRTRLLRTFEASGLAPLGLAGRVVRVRGWIISFDGPRINATHPEQIEVIPELSGALHRAPHSPCCNSSPRTRAAWNMAR